jgi:excisionase family DNA binding protein
MYAVPRWTVHQTAQYLACHPKTVYRLLWAGKLGYTRLNRRILIDADDVERILAASRVAPSPDTALPGALNEADIDSLVRDPRGRKAKVRGRTKNPGRVRHDVTVASPRSAITELADARSIKVAPVEAEVPAAD